MEITVQPHGQDAGVRSVNQVGFDMLRSVFAARQASTATVRALSSVQASDTQASLSSDSESPSSLALLTGRRPAGGGPLGGAFADHSGKGHPVAIQGDLNG
ncbi:hypothetical protein GV829_02660 [Sphingomonas lacunae]|uniref:Uncharacterized protein n=1 Tax=Sphingomonas lacunae TaxID=2698828 RepID=A0A6M4AQV5_9SPHN|nr:hypothetical protein [Sphingomonas lacunae]QJQ31484.1 hypothetical protein GV829_02660 [Sphingomonas lacunae]